MTLYVRLAEGRVLYDQASQLLQSLGLREVLGERLHTSP